MGPVCFSHWFFFYLWLCCCIYFDCSASFLPSFNNPLSRPLVEPTAVLCVYFLSVLVPLYRSAALLPHFSSVLERYIQTSFFSPVSLSYFLCNTLQLFENTASLASSAFWFSSSFLIHSHLRRLSSLYLFLSQPFSLCLCSDVQISWFYFYLFVPTRCSGVYP